MSEKCEICEKPGEISYRLNEAENDIKDLHGNFAATKKEIFERMDKLNSMLIGTLTAAVISLILLALNLISTGIR